MPIPIEVDVEGHRLVALALNPEATGEPIVLLHGLTMSVSTWLLFDFLCEYGPCYSLSLPGHYPATFPSNFDAKLLTMDMIAHVLTLAIHQLLGQHTRVTLIGISAGGSAALTIAAHSPNSVSRLVCVSGVAEYNKIKGIGRLGMRLAQRGFIGRAIQKRAIKAIQSRRGYAACLRTTFSNPRVFDTWPGRETFLEGSYANFLHLDPGAMVDYFRAGFNIDITPILPRITAPVLVLAGDCDPLVPCKQSQLIAKKVHNAELVIFEGVGHLLPIECPAEFIHVVGEWLQKTA